MTTVENPSPYYGVLTAYKRTEAGRIPFLAAIVALFTRANTANITAALDGEPDLVAVVPSKNGIPFDRQPLRRAVSMVRGLLEILKPVVAHIPGCVVPRNSYVPHAFSVDSAGVDGRRVLLIEDSMASGATAVSVGGALSEAGASVLILPIAKIFTTAYWGVDHPYYQSMQRPWEAGAWARRR